MSLLHHFIQPMAILWKRHLKQALFQTSPYPFVCPLPVQRRNHYLSSLLAIHQRDTFISTAFKGLCYDLFLDGMEKKK
jgi:hypothetical protein